MLSNPYCFLWHFTKIFVSLSVSKRDQTMNEFKYNIGYALSGGFIKGFAHLGIMQALHEHGIRPEILPE